MTDPCVPDLIKMFKGVSPEILKKAMEDLRYIKKKSTSPLDFKKQVANFSKEIRKGMALEIKDTAEGTRIKNKQKNFVRHERFKGMRADSLKSVLDGVNYHVPGGNLSIANTHITTSRKYLSQLVTALRDADLMKLARSKKFDLEILKYLYGVRDKVEVKVSPEAAAIAKIHGKITNGLQSELEMVGSSRNRMEGYIRVIHDSGKVANSKGQWKIDIAKELDWERTYGSRSADTAYIQKDLESIHDSMVLGEYNRGIVEGFKDGVMTIRNSFGFDKATSKHKHFYFKDADAEFRYRQKYGKGGVLENLVGVIERDARTIAVMDKLGKSPKSVFEVMKAEAAKMAKKDGMDPRKFSNKVKDLDNLYKSVVHGPEIGNSAVATFGENSRSLAGMAMLGGVIFTSAPSDLATGIVHLNAKTGKGYFKSFYNTLGSYFKSMSKKNRVEVAKRAQHYIDNALGDGFRRMNGGDNLSGLVSKGNDLYYKLNFLSQQTERFKSGNTHQFMMHLADNAGKTFDTMDPRTKAGLTRYGVTAEDWDILRTATEDLNGTKLISPYAVEQLDLDPKVKRDLRVKLAGYLMENSEQISTPTPGISQREALLGGTSPNTIVGQMVRMMMLFKSFGLTMHKTASHVMLSGGENAPRTIMEGIKTKAGMRSAAQLIVTTTTLGAIGLMLKDIATNKTPRDYDTREFWMEALVRGGSMGLYGDFLFAEYDKVYRSLGKDIAGPLLGGVFSDMAALFAGLRNGEPKAGKIFNSLIKAAPFVNLFYVRSALDYMILDEIQESLSPGYKSRKDRRLYDKGQELIFD